MGPRPRPEERRQLLALARAAIEARLAGDDDALGREVAALPLSPELDAPAAVFVTLKIPGEAGALELRGCIGTMVADRPLWRAVVDFALHAAFDDPRFPPLEADELARARLSVAVLTPLEPAPGPEAIVVGVHGVEIEKDGRRAVFLPQVAVEQRWDVPTLLRQLALKAGLGPDGWRGAVLRTFRAESFSE